MAVISTHLPAALRTFLLTLAVVDDLLAVTVIAMFYTDDVNPFALALALVPLAGFAIACRRARSPWLLAPLAILTWLGVHESGVHATVAGVLLGLSVPAIASGQHAKPLTAMGLAHRLQPWSAGLAVPLFAFFAAGVTIGGFDGFLRTLHDPVALGIIAGLVIGKPIGIVGAAMLTAALTRAELDRTLKWADVVGVSLLGGIGFTVSLLIGDLAFSDNPAREDHIKLGVLTGTLVAALFASVLLGLRNRAYRDAAQEPDAKMH